MTEQLVRGYPLPQLGPVIADLAAEAVALGAILLKAEISEEVFGIAPVESFHDPRHALLAVLLADMLEAGMPVDDPQVVVTEAIRRGLIGKLGGAPFVFDLRDRVAAPAHGPYHARRVRDMWIRRTAYNAAVRVIGKTTDEAQADTAEVLAVLAEAADEVMELYAADQAAVLPDFGEFMAVEERYDWVIPGLLERLNRLVLTGFEGHGKSTLFRQTAACAAQGVHPFTEQLIPRQRVLVIDAENSNEQIRRAFAPIILRLRRVLGREVLDWSGFHVLSRPDGLDLLHGEDMAWVERVVRAARPDIVALGPIYQLHNESPNDEQAAKKLIAFLNRLRVRHNCALLLEAHAGNAEDSRGNRKMRPIGASLYRRFPEFGLGMHPAKDTETLEDGTPLVMELTRWRGDRERRNWPFKIMRGGENRLPWINYREPQTYGAGMHWLEQTGDER